MITMCDHLSLLQSQSEQSGSEQDSAVESPLVDSVDSDSQQVVLVTLVVSICSDFTQYWWLQIELPIAGGARV